MNELKNGVEYWIDKDKIFHVEYGDLDLLSKDRAEQEIAKCTEMTGGKQALSVVDISNVKAVSGEAREFYASEKAVSAYKAVALITRTPISRVIGNFFLGLNKPAMPVRLFKDKEQALKWLKSQ